MPFAVILEFFRTQQRVYQVYAQEPRTDQSENRLNTHFRPPLLRASHAFTYPIAIIKNAKITPI